MKINIKFWIFIIIVSSVILLFKNRGIIIKDKFIPNRNVADKSILNAEKNTNVEAFSNTSFYSDTLITDIVSKTFHDSICVCKINYYSRSNFTLLDSFTVKLPQFAQPAYSYRKSILSIDRFNVVLTNLKVGTTTTFNIPNFKCFDLFAINDSSLILFGELIQGSKFTTGFFTYELATHSLRNINTLEIQDESLAPQNSLIYAGRFSRLDTSTLCYYCDKYSKYYIFSNTGDFMGANQTIDRSPKPQIISDGLAFYYKRGFTFNVNNSILKIGSKLVAFSCRSTPVSYILIDVYDFSTKKYLYSSKVNYRDWACPDIIQASFYHDNVIINFQHGVAMFHVSM